MDAQGMKVILVLITITMVQAKEDLEIMKEKMAEMNERFAKTEFELESTNDDLREALTSLATTKAELEG